MKSRMAAFGGHPEQALELSREAVALARLVEGTGMLALATAYEGFYEISLGQLGSGRSKQDHAAAMALSSDVDPVTGGLVYCSILWTCRAAADWSRAAQWSPGFELWCQAAYAEVSGTSRLHHAEILGAFGCLAEALSMVDEAIPKLAQDAPWALGDAYRVMGDIHFMSGSPELARENYAQAIGLGWDAQPGHAWLIAEEGNAQSAIASLDRVLAGRSWHELQRRGWLLANKARIAATACLEEEALGALKELESWGDQTSIPAIRAMTVETHADLAWAQGAVSEAVRLLYLARQLWTSTRHEYHAARLRLRIGEALEMSGDHPAAQIERAAARVVAERIGARKLWLQASAPLET